MNTVIILVRLSGTFRMRNPDATYLVRGAMHDMGVECMAPTIVRFRPRRGTWRYQIFS